jgi:prolyl 4-hydroxylase
MEKISRLSPELRDWILNTLKSGVKPEHIVEALIKKGFDTKFAYTTLLRMVGNKPVTTVGKEQRPYNYDTPTITQKEHTISTKDRDIHILMKIEKPSIIYLENVLSDDECDELITLSSSRLKPSQVIDTQTGERRLVPGRTSQGMYYQLNENNFITKIEKRISEIIDLPMEHGEGLQVLHYRKGEEYRPHFDFFPENKVEPDKGGQRVGTFLMYLNNLASGGETIFPKIGLSITPKKGSAIYFHYGNSKGQVDRLSLHSSRPVENGEKWVATKWLRQGRI